MADSTNTPLEQTDADLRPASEATRTTLFVLLAAAVYLYLNLFVLPNIPILLGGDQVFFWLDGQRLLYGQRIYQDFLQFTPPGTDLLYFALFKLFGFRIWVTNALVLALGVAVTWMCFSLARDLMGRSSALLTTAVFLVVVYCKPLNATQHWFSVLAVMGAVKTVFNRLTLRTLVLSGALIGLAAFFNQAHGAAALLAFAVFILWRRSRLNGSWSDLFYCEAVLILGFLLTILVLNAHLIATMGLKQLWFFQVTYVTKYVVNLTQGSRLGLPLPLRFRTLPSLAAILAVYAALPVAYLVALWRCLREKRDSGFPWDRIALLSILGLFFLIEVCMSLNWLRLFAVALPGILLIGFAFDRISALRRPALVFASIIIAVLAASQTVSAHRTASLRDDLPGGMAAINPQAYQKFHEIMSRTSPGDLFFQAGWPGMYLPLQLRNPLYLDIAYAIRPEEAERVVQQLHTSTIPLILWSAHLDDPCVSNRPCDEGTAILRDYVHRSYVRIHVFPDGDTLWQSNQAHP
jgi:hypothetical protein